MFIHTICKCLESANIEYAVVGGYAVSLHGFARSTVDVDIVLHWTLDNLKKVETSFKKIGLISQVPITAELLFQFRDEYIQNRNFIAWNFYNPKKPLEQVDIIINYDLKKGHTKTIHTASGNIKILSVKDLISMKKASGRPQDLEDIKFLETL